MRTRHVCKSLAIFTVSFIFRLYSSRASTAGTVLTSTPGMNCWEATAGSVHMLVWADDVG